MKFNIFSQTTNSIIAIIMAYNFYWAEKEFKHYMNKTGKDQTPGYTGFYIQQVQIPIKVVHSIKIN